jgi:hypothetical protein
MPKIDDEALRLAREIFTQEELEEILYIENSNDIEIDLDEILADEGDDCD